MRRSTHELALAGLLAALSVVLLSLGSMLPLATYAAPVLASSVLLAAREECRPSFAWCCYAASASSKSTPSKPSQRSFSCSSS